MSQTAFSAPADRLAFIIEGLCLTVARSLGLGGLAGPFIILVWSRLRRIAARFTLHARTPACPPALIAIAAKPRAKPPKSVSRPLPRRRAWLLRLVPEAASGASQLRHFLTDPEVAILLANAPQLRRILSPLCHMLGIRASKALPAQALPAEALPPPDAPPAAPAIPRHVPPQAAPIALPLVPFPPWAEQRKLSPALVPHTLAPRLLA